MLLLYPTSCSSLPLRFVATIFAHPTVARDLERKLLAVKKIRFNVLDFQGGTELFTVNPLNYAREQSMLDKVSFAGHQRASGKTH